MPPNLLLLLPTDEYPAHTRHHLAGQPSEGTPMTAQSTSQSGTTQPGTINQPVTAPIPVAGTQREHP